MCPHFFPERQLVLEVHARPRPASIILLHQHRSVHRTAEARLPRAATNRRPATCCLVRVRKLDRPSPNQGRSVSAQQARLG